MTPKPSRDDKKAARRMEKDKESFDHYCPRCQVFYPASSTAHVGH